MKKDISNIIVKEISSCKELAYRPSEEEILIFKRSFPNGILLKKLLKLTVKERMFQLTNYLYRRYELTGKVIFRENKKMTHCFSYKKGKFNGVKKRLSYDFDESNNKKWDITTYKNDILDGKYSHFFAKGFFDNGKYTGTYSKEQGDKIWGCKYSHEIEKYIDGHISEVLYYDKKKLVHKDIYNVPFNVVRENYKDGNVYIEVYEAYKPKYQNFPDFPMSYNNLDFCYSWSECLSYSSVSEEIIKTKFYKSMSSDAKRMALNSLMNRLEENGLVFKEIKKSRWYNE